MRRRDREPTRSRAALASLELQTSAVEPETQRSLVVGFHGRVSEAARGDELGAMFECLGQSGTTAGGEVDIDYWTGTNGAVLHARSHACSYPDAQVCACMQDVVSGWELTSSVGAVEVSVHVRINPGRLPDEMTDGEPRDGQLW